MPAQPPATSDRVTVLVFKDNYAARTFQVPLAWMTRLGVLLCLGAAGTAVSTLLAIKYYRIARTASPARVEDLEIELAELRSAYRSLEGKLQVAQATPVTGLTPATTQTAPVAEASPLPAASPALAVTVADTPTASAPLPSAAPVSPPAEAVAPAAPGMTLLKVAAVPPSADRIKLLPDQAFLEKPDPKTLPIVVAKPSLRWRGNQVIIRSSIQYTKRGGGNQQGRIVILARSADQIYGYPTRVMPPTSAEILVQPSRGEFFSVSRYRGIEAKLGPFKSPQDLTHVDLMIFDTQGKLLVSEKLEGEALAKALEQASPPAAVPVAAPAAPVAPAKRVVDTPAAEEPDAESAAPTEATEAAPPPATEEAAPAGGP